MAKSKISILKVGFWKNTLLVIIGLLLFIIIILLIKNFMYNKKNIMEKYYKNINGKRIY